MFFINKGVESLEWAASPHQSLLDLAWIMKVSALAKTMYEYDDLCNDLSCAMTLWPLGQENTMQGLPKWWIMNESIDWMPSMLLA